MFSWFKIWRQLCAVFWYGCSVKLIGLKWYLESTVASQAGSPWSLSFLWPPPSLPKPTKLAITKKEANYTRVKGGEGRPKLLLFLSFIRWSSHFYLFRLAIFVHRPRRVKAMFRFRPENLFKRMNKPLGYQIHIFGTIHEGKDNAVNWGSHLRV